VKRLILLVLALAAFASSTVSTASAAVPCRDRIYNDWYADGKIATTYPLTCYRDALKHVPADAREYSSLADDIRSAMQSALARLHGRPKVPAQVGKGQASTKTAASKTRSKTTPVAGNSRTDASSRAQPVSQTLPTSTVASGRAGGGGSVPVPLVVLGALALLLVAVGGVGAIAKRRRT
jgi:hypothetical protein